MEIRSLTTVSLSEITATFNEAFSDYLIPLQFSEEGMATKIKGEGIDKRYSVGAFESGRLVGFMLHGYAVIEGVKTVYNAGTGVIPPFRGQGIATAMYRYSIPSLQKEGIYTHLLEVIDTNTRAKKIYEAIGFQTVRTLRAFKSTVPVTGASFVTIRQLDALPTDPAFFSMQPSWQNSSHSINRDLENHHVIGAYHNNSLVGYAAFVPATGRVRQCGVHIDHRRKGVGRALFQYMFEHSGNGQLMLTNVDEAYQPAIRFLYAMQFQPFLQLYEMNGAWPRSLQEK